MANINEKQKETNVRRKFNNAELREAQDKLAITMKNHQYYHDHKRKDGTCLEPVSETNKYVKDPSKYGPDAVICRDCGEIFNMRQYSAKEIEDGVMMFKSMLNQIKYLAQLNDAEYEDIVKLLEVVDTQLGDTLTRYYLSMMNKLSDKDRRRQPESSKGFIGGIGGNSYGPSRNTFHR